jgi:hypothetical protein
MGVAVTKQRSACRVCAPLGTVLLACGLAACIRAPALVVGARSTLVGDRGPLRIVMLCGLDWSRPMRGAEPIGSEWEVETELEPSATAESVCTIAALCEWESDARRDALLRTLTGLPEVAP